MLENNLTIEKYQKYNVTYMQVINTGDFKVHLCKHWSRWYSSE